MKGKGFIFKSCLAVLLAVFAAAWFPADAAAADRLQETDGRPVIVIDPGHGGGNLGTTSNDHDEKAMTLTTAMAMYEELSLYDDVEVYLTRTDDKDMDLDERAQFAKDVGADFLFSIHYNASETQENFGSEIWVSAFAPYNGYGYQFGYEFLTNASQRGLFVRGVKTRLNDRGTDWYGIIRECVALEIPAAILEHCFVDEARDEGYCDSEEDLKQFGRDDATAVAKYFGLKSSALNVDYSDYQLVTSSTQTPVAVTAQDTTDPDVCVIEKKESNPNTGLLSLTVTAADYDSCLTYYDYSIDGGETFSSRYPWPDSNALTCGYRDTFTLTLTIPSGVSPSVIVRAYNMYDFYTESNRCDIPQVFSYNSEAEPGPEESAGRTDSAQESTEDEPTENVTGNNGSPQEESREDTGAFAEESSAGILPAVSDDLEQKKPVRFTTFLEICLIVVAVLFVLLLVSQAIAYFQRKKRRRQGRNHAEDRGKPHR